MPAELLDGNVAAQEIGQQIREEIEELKTQGRQAHLVAVQVGENPASRVYLRKQKEAFESFGIPYTLQELPADTTREQLIAAIEELNNDDSCTGIILQMPLPEGIDSREIQTCISAVKDVEAITPENMGKLVFNDFRLAPCTAAGAFELYKRTGESLAGKEVVIVGHSEIVGKPLALMMLGDPVQSATPTICHIATRDLAAHTKQADVIFVAVGKPGLITGDMIKEGAVVIDIGINRVDVLDENGQQVLNDKGRPKKKTVGDVDFESAVNVCSRISPVPGGVGPLTVVMLVANTVRSAAMQA